MRHSIGGSLRNRSHRSSSASASEEPRDTAEGEDTEVVEPEQGNVLSHIISQLRPGADLSRVTLPTFILEPRSMLERITNFMAHPDTLLPMPKVEDPVERFVAVVKFYLSGWHIRPPGVKKPLNPILGETFTCYWDYPDGTRGYYIAEQTSHHPPKSSYFFMAPYHHIRVDGTLKPRSKFLGNSAASMMEGISYLRFTNRGKSKGGEKYILTQPNMYARGILFGKMKYELGDHSYVRCPENNLSADIEFKTKGWMGGTYNAIGGAIKNDKTGEVLYELSGLWSGEMYIKDVKTGQKKTLFDATHAKHSPPRTRPLEEQGDRESQKLWYNTVKAVKAADHEKATMEKAKIEDQQREEAKRREELGVEWQPQLFRRVDAKKGGSEEGEEDLEWIIHAHLDSKDPKELEQKILSIAPILPGQGKPGGPEHRPHQQAHTKEAAQPPAEASVKQGQAGANNPPMEKTTRQHAPQQAPPKQAAPPVSEPTSNLIDFDSKPAPSNQPGSSQPTQPKESVAAPAAPAGQAVQPTSNQQGVAPVYEAITVDPPTGHSSQSANLMDDDNDISHMNSQMSRLKMHEAMVPEGQAPLKRADTETSEVDVFVDAQS
ncbi:Oxysterol-binding protein-like protein OBPalpha [Exophiala dermatitidis]